MRLSECNSAIKQKGNTPMKNRMDRRNWLTCLGGILAAGTLLGKTSCKSKTDERAVGEEGKKFNHYFGDLHNHCSVGYARGSVERLFEIAESHLDFLCFTPHSHWHDVPIMEQNKQQKWLKGFEVTRRRWPDVQELNRQYHKPGRFVTFPGYEWHSSQYGDFCLVFPTDDSPLTHYDSLRQLQEFAFQKGALLIPHHPGYRQGRRGANPKFWDERVTRLLEIYSEHGNAECDEGPFDYIRHSMGGRWTPNTLQAILAKGYRVGVLASSDDHLGYPGAYGEGLAVILAEELTREALFEALRKRRVYGVTGDRIRLDFTLNAQAMGQVLPACTRRRIKVSVEGWDRIKRVELLKNNRVIHREFPEDRQVSSGSLWSSPLLVRLELGWGPWAALGMPRICDWEMEVRINGGKLLDLQPCFQSGPYSEERRNLVRDRTSTGFGLISYTSRLQAFAEKATNAVVLKIQGGPETELVLEITKPSVEKVSKRLSELLESNEVIFTGPFPDESILVHRPVPLIQAQSSFSLEDKGGSERTDWYYLRVIQENGQLAWSSPIWVEAENS